MYDFQFAFRPKDAIVHAYSMAIFSPGTWGCVLGIFFAANFGLLSSAQGQISGCAGTVDPSFNATGISPYSPIAMDGDKVIAANYRGVIRFNEGGSIDPSFLVSVTGPFGTEPVSTIIKSSQGRWLIGGPFSEVNFEQRARVARLLSTGDLDPNFVPRGGIFELTLQVSAITEQSDGKVIVGARAFTTNGWEGFVVRLNSDGSTDPGFNIGRADNWITSIALESDGGILVGGIFANFDGKSRNQ